MIVIPYETVALIGHLTSYRKKSEDIVVLLYRLVPMKIFLDNFYSFTLYSVRVSVERNYAKFYQTLYVLYIVAQCPHTSVSQ